ncbi:MAG: hypothetical protein U9R54_07175 [Bacteroidota bacterium]|nr:hypothetical protein [Bacteroidota bacterium]
MLLKKSLVYITFFLLIFLFSCKKAKNNFNTYEIDSLIVETNNQLSRIYSIDIYKIDSILALYTDTTDTTNYENSKNILHNDSLIIEKLKRSINWYYTIQDEIIICQEELKLLKKNYNNFKIEDTTYLDKLKKEKRIVKDFEIRVDTSIRTVQSDFYDILSKRSE